MPFDKRHLKFCRRYEFARNDKETTNFIISAFFGFSAFLNWFSIPKREFFVSHI